MTKINHEDTNAFNHRVLLEKIRLDYTYLSTVTSDLQTEDLIDAAFDNSWRALGQIKKPTDAHFLRAVALDGEAISLIPESRLTEELCVEAINTGTNRDIHVIELIKNQTEAMCLASVLASPGTISCCHVLTEKVCLAALHEDYSVFNKIPKEFQTREVSLTALYASPNTARWLRNDFNEDFYVQACEMDGTLLMYFKDEIKSSRVCMAAVKQHWRSLGYVPKHLLTEEICILAYNQNIQALRFLWADQGFESRPVSLEDHRVIHTFITYHEESSPKALVIESMDRLRTLEYSLYEQKNIIQSGEVVQVTHKPRRLNLF